MRICISNNLYKINLNFEQSLDERKRMFQEEWARNDDEMRNLRLSLAHSMPKRCQQVIANLGHRIKY